MATRAVLVGVSDYQNHATNIEAAVPEMERWYKLLRDKYFFQKAEIQRLPDPDVGTAKLPTKKNILASFEWLVTNSTEHDLLLFFFMGHGRLVNAHDVDDPRRIEEALIAYPDGDSTLVRAEITDTDLARIVRANKVPTGAAFMMMIDSCYAGALNGDIPKGAKVLSIPQKVRC